MENTEMMELLNGWANDILVWVGFGTLVGLLAKGLMPGRDPGGSVATICMGIGGTIIGCGSWAFFIEGQRVTPISPVGFIVATAGAFLILVLYRILSGYWFTEGDVVTRRHSYRRRRQRRYHGAHQDDI